MTDTYQGFKGLTADQVRALIQETGPYMADPLQLAQSESPTVGELLAIADKWSGTALRSTLDGYVIRKPRDNHRVAVDAITIRAPFLGLAWVQEVVALALGADQGAITETSEGVEAYIWWN